jgi:TRAP-type mannitol/chloroaromatic compound transport system permease small subunit
VGSVFGSIRFLLPVCCAYTCMFNVYRNQLSRQTGSRNLTGPKTLPTIWHTYMKIVTKYQIPVSVFGPIRFLLPVCRLSWFLYTLNIYAHFLSHFWNLTGPKTLPTIWHTYMKIVTKYQIPVINSCWEKMRRKIIFLSNYWWQRSDIWPQASYRYPISWEAFLDPSDSYFVQCV